MVPTNNKSPSSQFFSLFSCLREIVITICWLFFTWSRASLQMKNVNQSLDLTLMIIRDETEHFCHLLILFFVNVFSLVNVKFFSSIKSQGLDTLLQNLKIYYSLVSIQSYWNFSNPEKFSKKAIHLWWLMKATSAASF